MIPNHSPWIHQLNRTRPVVSLGEHISTDTLVVGGGIAGVVTAYFVLKHTKQKVLLLEADKIAHGATGHNAGQVTSYFERPLHNIAEEFGIKMATEGQYAVESAWALLEEIIADASIKTPLYRFVGYAGFALHEHFLSELKSCLVRVRGGLEAQRILVAEDAPELLKIPHEYKGLYVKVPRADILSLLETDNPQYFACVAEKKGCTNSASFTEELLAYLASHYRDRFSFFEGTPVSLVELNRHSGIARAGNFRIAARHIVLCTNGFENFHIQNNAGHEIETMFHHTVQGRIGYMAGYAEASQHPPIAISYYPKFAGKNFDPTGEPYFYLTRRPFEHEKKEHRLVCIGGPEKVLPNNAVYSRENAGLEEIQWQDEAFLEENYRPFPKGAAQFIFFWHGLMGYTPNRLRRIGYEPLNPVLMYNLGCNGVGILPSIYGGKKISQLLLGRMLEPSIFDPQDQRKFKTILARLFRFFKKRRQRVR